MGLLKQSDVHLPCQVVDITGPRLPVRFEVVAGLSQTQVLAFFVEFALQ